MTDVAGAPEEATPVAPATGVAEAGVGGVSLQLPGEAISTLILVGDAVYLSPEDHGGYLRLARIVSFSEGTTGKEVRAVQYISPADVDLPADLLCSPNEVFETDLLVDVPVTEIVGRARVVTPRPGSAPGGPRTNTEETHVCSKFIDTSTGTVTDLVLDRGDLGGHKRLEMATSEDGTPGRADLGAREVKRSRSTPPARQMLSNDGGNALGATGSAQDTPNSAGGAGAVAGHTPWPADEIEKGKEALFSMLVDIEATSASRAVNKMTLSTAAFQKLGDMGLMQHCLRALMDGQISREGYSVRQKSSVRGAPLLWLHRSGAAGTNRDGPGCDGLLGGPISLPTSPTQWELQPGPFGTVRRRSLIESGGQPSTAELKELRQDVADLRQELEQQKYANAPQVNRGKAKKLSSRDVARITKSCLSIMRRELKLALLTNYDREGQRSAAFAPNLGDLTGLFASSETADARHREVMHRHLQLRRDLEGMQADICGRVKKCEEKCAWAVGTCEGFQDRLQGGVEALVRAQQELKKEISTVLFESMQALQKLESKIDELRTA